MAILMACVRITYNGQSYIDKIENYTDALEVVGLSGDGISEFDIGDEFTIEIVASTQEYLDTLSEWDGW